MYTFLLVIHVIVCVGLIISVLMQSSKGGGLGGAFGGGAGNSNTLFGTEGASKFIKKVTEVLGISFMVITILLAVTSGPMNTTDTETGVSDELQKEIDKQEQTQQPQGSTLPEGFEQLPEPEEEQSE